MAKEQNFAHPPRGHVAILAYDDVNDRWQVVECSPEGYLKIRWMDQVQTVLIQQMMPSLLQPGINTYDGSAWRKQPPIWGYTDRLAEYDTWVKSGAGTALETLFTVPPGYVYVVTATMSINRDKDVVQHHLLHNAVTYFSIKSFAPPGIAVWAINDNVNYVLKAGDSMRFQWLACNNLDNLDASVWGYKMKIDM